MNILRKFTGGLASVAGAITAVALVVYTLIIVVNVALRHAFNTPLFWAYEVSTYLFIYSVFLGGSVALMRCELMCTSDLRDRLPHIPRRMLEVLSHGVAMLFSGLAATFSWTLLEHAIRKGTMSPALEIPMYVVYLPLPLGFALMALFSFVLLLGSLRKLMGLEK